MQHGRDFISKTHHPRMGEYREHSKLWEARRLCLTRLLALSTSHRRASDACMADAPQATAANRTVTSHEAVYSQIQRERLSAEGGPQKVGKERVCFSHRYVGTAEERARRDAARRASSLPEMSGRGAAASGKKRLHAETDGSKQTKLEMWYGASSSVEFDS